MPAASAMLYVFAVARGEEERRGYATEQSALSYASLVPQREKERERRAGARIIRRYTKKWRCCGTRAATSMLPPLRACAVIKPYARYLLRKYADRCYTLIW